MARVLITGNQGYIGTMLSPYLEANGFQVVGYDTGFFRSCFLGPRPADPPQQIQKDVRDCEDHDLDGIDAVIHLAGLSNDPAGELQPSATEDINYSGTIRLAEIAKRKGVQRFIYASSQSMYGISNVDEELDEDQSEKNPLTAYAKTKWLAECELTRQSSSSFQVISVRPSTVFGRSPRLRCDIVYNNLVGSAFSKGKIEVKSDGTPWRPVIHIEDVCQSFLAVLRAPQELISGRSFNLGIPEGNYTIRELAQTAQSVVPGAALDFTYEHGSDARTYRVSFKRILSELAEYYQPEFDLLSGGKDLVQFFERVAFTENDFDGVKVNRLGQLRYLKETNRIDEDLRWIT